MACDGRAAFMMRARFASPTYGVVLVGTLALLSPAWLPMLGGAEAGRWLRLDPLFSLCLAQPEGGTSPISLAPPTVLPLILAALVYGRGLLTAGRASPGRALAAFGGLAALALAVASPLCRMSAM